MFQFSVKENFEVLVGNMGEHQCQYCGKVLTTQKRLEDHLEKAQYCLKQRTEKVETMSEEIDSETYTKLISQIKSLEELVSFIRRDYEKFRLEIKQDSNKHRRALEVNDEEIEKLFLFYDTLMADNYKLRAEVNRLKSK